jgi:hypothetical protein
MHDNLIPGRRNTNAKPTQDLSQRSDPKMNGHFPQSTNVNDQQTPLSDETNEQPVDILTFMGFKL